MKLLVVLLPIVALCAGNSIPLIPGDNSHYVEGVTRYVWIPDSEGVPQIQDLQAPVDEELLLQTRNGANNVYRLFTSRNPTNAQTLVHGNANSISNSNYNSGLPTKVIVHGLNQNGNSPLNPLITSAFLAVGNFNVIVVDWNRLANGYYTTAVNGVPNVGQHLGNFLVWLFNTAGGNWNNLHLVGFSLGAHVVGNAGRTASARPGRITGLDPAGFLWHNNANALNRHDGVYVESIHTDGGLLGILDAISDADFYPNGGQNRQPGCSTSICSHGRAPELFASSIRNDRFTGRRCDNIRQAVEGPCTGATLNMGNARLGKRGSGLYRLVTGSSWPF